MKNLDQAVKTLLEMFQSRNFPEHVAFTIIKRKACDTAAKPSDKWSIGNILIMAFIGKTDDARTYKQWQAAHRQVKRGAKAFHIYAPVTRKVKRRRLCRHFLMWPQSWGLLLPGTHSITQN